MSRGRVQTLPANAQLGDIARRAQQVGHTCWPVLHKGEVVGLLHLRDLERALQHRLGELRVCDLMQTGTISLREDEELPALEEALAKQGRDSVAVVNASGHLLGMASRGDLLRFRRNSLRRGRMLSLDDVPYAILMAQIAEAARQLATPLWLVGGTVRDLLLGRPGDDVDLVVEDSPAGIARAVKARLGGRLGPKSPFDTLRWTPDENVAAALDLAPGCLPAHVDFAGARAETYAHPAALPEVYRSTLLRDLGRRDFTINALALPIAPEPGPVIDPFGGLADLDAGRIRVLHSLSFHDDPLRILRAWRFRARFGFEIERRTAELMQVATPALGQITGTRLRNELDLVLQEDDPGSILLAMQDSGVLPAMHPAFRVPVDIAERFRRAQRPAEQALPPRLTSTWHALATGLPPEATLSLCERLQFPPKTAQSMLDANLLANDPGALAEQSASTLQLVKRLKNVSYDAAWCVRQLADSELVRARLLDWLTRWPKTQTCCSGHDLLAAGLSPGPAIARILLQLRIAWYDGDVNSEAGERALLNRLVAAEKAAVADNDA